MRVLDVGCGPGSITVGLAEAVAPGRVVGLDVQPSVLGEARAHAAARRTANVAFQAGSATALPFPDGAFDAVFAHTLLEHVREPLAVLREVRRVLRPGGVLGVRDVDWGSGVLWPPDPLVALAAELYARAWERSGGHPAYGRRLARPPPGGGVRARRDVRLVPVGRLAPVEPELRRVPGAPPAVAGLHAGHPGARLGRCGHVAGGPRRLPGLESAPGRLRCDDHGGGGRVEGVTPPVRTRPDPSGPVRREHGTAPRGTP